MQTRIENGELIIEIDISEKAIKAAPMSKSGKNKLIASTGGFLAVGEGFRIGLNVIH